MHMPRKTELEYKLRIIPYVDKRLGKGGHLIELETVKEFRTFKYDIQVDLKAGDGLISLIIEGINAPQLSIPEHGPAQFSKMLYDLKGTYTVRVSKSNGAENSFELQFSSRKTIQKKKKIKNRFVELETTHKE
jgi:hypothetical protein